MKIVHISTFDFGGAGLCAYRICKLQREMGLDSHMLVLQKCHSESFVHTFGFVKWFIFRLLRKLNLLTGDYRTLIRIKKTYNKTYSLPKSVFDLSKSKLVRSADIIHIHWASDFLDYSSFFKSIGKTKKIVLTLHDENLFLGIAHYKRDELPDNELERKYKLLKSVCIENAHNLGVVFLSRMMYNQYSNVPMLAKAKTTVINNFVDYTLFLPCDKAVFRRKFGIPLESKMFAFCAYSIYDKRKGLDVLSRALFKINPDFKVLAIGNANLPQDQEEYPNVISLGASNSPQDISEKFSCADYFCMPSYQEAFAQTPIEAMACGLPIVVFPCSGSDEIVNENTGVRCKEFTEESLMSSIRQIINKKYDSNLIRQFVIDNFSPNEITKRYINFYSKL